MTRAEEERAGAADAARVQIEVARRRRASELRGLAEAALELTAATTVDEVLRVLTESAQAIVGAHQAVSSRLVHGWSDASTFVSLSDKYARWRDYDEVPKGLGVLNFVTRGNRPLRLTGEELARHPDWRGLRDAPDHPPLPNYLAAPLVGRDGSNLGLVQLSDKTDGGEFSAEDEAILVQLAQLASNGIESIEALERERAARLAAELEHDRLEALRRVGAAIMARHDLREVVQIATDAATGLIPAAFGAFFYNVTGEDGEALMLYTLSGAPRSAFERFPLPRATPIFQPTFHGEGNVRLDDVTQDPRYGRMAPHRGMPPGHLEVRSYLAVPVRTPSGEVAGGLFFGHPEPGLFRPEHEQLVEGIADQAGIAIENARLIEAAGRELAARQRAFEERDRVARVLQASLLPPTLPDIPGAELAARYRAGQAGIGGDFYDIFRLEEGAWGIVLGDVCGKGPEAAARTALARHSVRAAATLERSPAAVLAVLNEALLRDEADGRFCTAVFARLELAPDGGRLLVASGGHPPVIVARAGGEIERVEATGTLLGVFEEARCDDAIVELAAGDRVVLHTDGLIDARRRGELFGERRALELIRRCNGAPVGELADRLAGAAERFEESGAPDDVALVVLRVLGAPVPRPAAAGEAPAAG